MFFLLFTGYFILRPVRETLGVASGPETLHWLFTGTFVATVAVLPVFGWVASKVSRRSILPWTYGFFVANLLGFAAALAAQPDNLWTARAFYIWLSVFNLLAVSLAWSVAADIFVSKQAKRLFVLIAGGASFGGPIFGTLLIAPIGHAGLLVFSALLLAGSAGAAIWLHRWRDCYPVPDAWREAVSAEDGDRHRPLGAKPFAGATEVFKSPYLIGIALFVLLLSSISTFLYFEQARLVAETFPDRTQQTQVFGAIDSVVQARHPYADLLYRTYCPKTGNWCSSCRCAGRAGCRFSLARDGSGVRCSGGRNHRSPGGRIRSRETWTGDALHLGVAETKSTKRRTSSIR